MNTPSTSTSGNVHGMSLAALSGPEPAELASIGDVIPTIRPLNAPQKALGRDSGVHLFTMSDIDRLALATVTQRTLSLIGRGRADPHLSFDLDMCDPAIAPGVPPLAGRPELSRSAHADGTGDGHGPSASSGTGRSQPDGRHPPQHGRTGGRVRAGHLWTENSVARLATSNPEPACDRYRAWML